MTQFHFLEREWPAVYEVANKAAEAAHPDPRTACFYARRVLEIPFWLARARARPWHRQNEAPTGMNQKRLN